MVSTLVTAGLALAALAVVLGAAGLYFNRVRSIPRRVVSRLLGGPGQYASRALVFLLVLFGAGAGVGIMYALTSDVSTSGSSAPVIGFLLEYATNGWGYVVAALVFGRGSLWAIRSSLIRRAARETGYEARTIKRFAQEIRTTDGTTRVIAFDHDDHDDLAGRIFESFSDATDEVIRRAGGDAQEAGGDGEADDLPVPVEGTSQPEETDPSDLSLGERLKLWRLDLASALNIDAVVWRFAVPAGITFVATLIVARIWVVWWLYLAFAALALAVGLGTYLGTRWWRSRKLSTLRQPQTEEHWDEIAVLTKAVETDEMTVYMGFMDGRRYASTSATDLSEALAKRALERANGSQPSPAIEERYAWCLDHYILTLDAWREQMELPKIQDALVNEVLDAEEGMLPKRLLAHRVVEDGRRYIWQGTRFVGLGHDPDLVAQEYERLSPNTLVERDLELTGPDGKAREVTAVRARTEPLPPEVAELRASFSERFPRRRIPTRYDLPDVEVSEDVNPYIVSSD